MNLFGYIASDYRAAMKNDPAIPRSLRGFFEIVFCTPGFLAITFHRIFHFLHSTLRIPVIPRFLSLITRLWTGIEIHPGATIGKGFFVDHGAGVVIGETTVIGDNVTIYQGVTLGGTGKEKGSKRHPTIGNNVFIGAGAKILGPIVLGNNVRVGANSVVLKDVPDNATVVGIRARLVRKDGEKFSCTQSNHTLSNEELLAKIFAFEEEISILKDELAQFKDVSDGEDNKI